MLNWFKLNIEDYSNVKQLIQSDRTDQELAVLLLHGKGLNTDEIATTMLKLGLGTYAYKNWRLILLDLHLMLTEKGRICLVEMEYYGGPFMSANFSIHVKTSLINEGRTFIINRLKQSIETILL